MPEVKVGKLVKEHLNSIIEYCKQNSDELINLCKSEYCSKVFNLNENYPFFKLVNEINEEDIGIEQGPKTISYRYWRDEHMINSKQYRVCSQWYKNNGDLILNYLTNKNILLEKYHNNKPVFFSDSRTKTYDNIHVDSKQLAVDIEKIRIKNIILYGSPGVGKTHNTNRLISLIEEGKSDREIFEAIKKNEQSNSVDISDIKERVKFVTFHQSFGYEDFIEGFRPNEEGNIELVDGVFKSIARQAQDNLDNASKDKKFDFENFLNAFVNYVESSEKFELEEGLTIAVSKKANGDFQSFKLGGRVKHQSLTKDIIKRDFDAYLKEDISHYQEIKPTYESQSPYHGNAPYYFKLYGVMKKFLDDNNEKFQIKNTDLKNYYLIIDEINRGNISKIFGELITLIEEDKRDNLEVTLPYSKQPFKIPSNLYIIGTMNSTDKSIALIDIALRRRFTFLKMEPNLDLVKNEKAKSIMKKINEQITKDLGEDYQIGHSYFMKIADDNDLDFVLEYKIIPLLEEYYYGDDRFDEIVKFCKLDRGDN